MPRPLWTGAISFGLVTIPVKIISATEDRSVRFHQVHLKDGGRVRTRKVCELDDEVVRQEEIGKGYELTKDQMVPISDEELEEMPLPTAKAIEIAAFISADSIDPIRIGDSYYLAVDGQVAAKPYTLLRKALERSDKVAVAKFAWHGRERLGLLRVREGAIVLHSLRWPDEIRSPQPLAPRAIDLDDDEIERAVQLTDTMAMDDASGFRDQYRDALEELIAAKSEGKEFAEAGRGRGAGAREGRGPDGRPERLRGGGQGEPWRARRGRDRARDAAQQEDNGEEEDRTGQEDDGEDDDGGREEEHGQETGCEETQRILTGQRRPIMVMLPRIAPMLATPGSLPPAAVEDRWAFEVKHDGQRVVIYLPGDGTVTLRARSGADITLAYPELEPLGSMLGRPAVLDGEIVALDSEGRSDFERLQARMGLAGSPTKAARMTQVVPAHLILFDAVFLDHSLIRLPYTQRRTLLEDLDLNGAHWATCGSGRRARGSGLGDDPDRGT